MIANQLLVTQRLLTTDEAAQFMALGKRTIQELVADGRLAHVKIGRSIRFDIEDLQRFVESQKKKAAGWKKTA
jgi:excisionase family DNA binding protein